MSNLPCKNPNCHSVGKAHPNCRCYSNLAKGGEVSFCAQGMPHQKGCKYFKDGGDTIPEAIKADDSGDSGNPNHGVNININAQPQPQLPPAGQPAVRTDMAPQQAPQVSATPPPALAQNVAPAPAQMTPIAPPPEPETTDNEEASNAKEFDQADQVNPGMDEKIHAPDDYGHPSLPMPGQSTEQYKSSVYDTLNQQAQQVSADYANGHITPKTYHDLYAEKGTLGKIGMIFSLMLGGAGAGLTHGPNAALAMMDKMIDNDLQAQRASKSDQMNFLNTAANFYRTKSETALQGKQGELYDAQKALAETNNDLLKVNLAKTTMMLGAVHHLYGLTDKMPSGPGKAQALQAANGVNAAVNQKIAQDNAKTAAAVGANSENAYNKTTQELRSLQLLGQEGAGEQVKYREEHMIPGVGTTTVPVSEAARDRVLKINNFQNLIKEAKEFQKNAELGALTPAQKARALQLKSDLVSSYNDVKGLNRFTGNEENLYDKIIPNLGSNIGALTGTQKGLLDRIEKTVQQKKDLEYKQLGVKPFSGASGDKESDDMVSVVSRSGQPGMIPKSNLKKALSLGYKQANQ